MAIRFQELLMNVLSLPFCRDDSACGVTYWVAKHYQGFSSLACPWGLISTGGVEFISSKLASELKHIGRSMKY